MDEKNLIIGTFLFRFNPATIPAETPDQPAGYQVNFGELLNGELTPSGDLKKAYDSISGVVGLLKAIKTKREIELTADLQKIDPTIVMPYYMGAASGNAPVPGKITDGFGYLAIQGEGEPVVAAPGANIGDAIFRWYAFPCGLYVDGALKANGEDFSTLKLHVLFYLGRGVGTYKAAARPVVVAP